MELESIRRGMEEIARRAGKIIREAQNIQDSVSEKTGPGDVVTRYDVAVQQFLKEELKKLCPEADFLGEEGEHEALSADWVFVVDPIDGTTNFVRSFRYSNTSIALTYKGRTEVGVVYHPYADELFSARRGCGAACNGKSIHVSRRDVRHGIALLGCTVYTPESTDRFFRINRALYDRFCDYRRFGAGALDLCQIAAGRAELYYEFRLRPWDFAAGCLLVEEAGGVVCDMEGRELNVLQDSSLFCANRLCAGERELFDRIG